MTCIIIPIGPPGSGKSFLNEELKSLFETSVNINHIEYSLTPSICIILSEKYAAKKRTGVKMYISNINPFLRRIFTEEFSSIESLLDTYGNTTAFNWPSTLLNNFGIFMTIS